MWILNNYSLLLVGLALAILAVQEARVYRVRAKRLSDEELMRRYIHLERVRRYVQKS